MMLVNARTNEIVTLDDRAQGEGGRATVHSVVGHPNLLAKVLEPGFRTQERRKKAAVVRNVLGQVHCHVTRPLDMLIDSDGTFCGYLMTKVEGLRLDMLLANEHTTLSFRISLAWQLAKEVDRLHRRNILVGDLAKENCQYCSEERALYLLDSDSFQVIGPDGTLYPTCEAHMKSREMLDFGLGSGHALSEHSDDFLLAYLIHELIFLRDPLYAYDPDLPIEAIRMKALRSYEYPYPHESDAMPLSLAGNLIASYFIEAFTTNYVPTASEWVLALEYVIEKGFDTCLFCGEEHLSSNDTCPFCSMPTYLPQLQATA